MSTRFLRQKLFKNINEMVCMCVNNCFSSKNLVYMNEIQSIAKCFLSKYPKRNCRQFLCVQKDTEELMCICCGFDQTNRLCGILTEFIECAQY